MITQTRLEWGSYLVYGYFIAQPAPEVPTSEGSRSSLGAINNSISENTVFHPRMLWFFVQERGPSRPEEAFDCRFEYRLGELTLGREGQEGETPWG